MRNVIAAIVLIGAPLAAGAIGSIASINAPEFYAGLERPTWAPPSWLFGPVWTALYVMMGVAAFLVWRDRGSAARGLLAFFLVHLFFNAIWSWLFFAWQKGTLSIADIVIMWLMILTLIIGFYRIRPIAGFLLVPYLFWVSYATALNAWIVQKNPERFS